MNRTIDVTTLASLPTVPALPEGWLNGFDATVLYNLARIVGGSSRILEVGSWIGRSSCVVAYGIRDLQDPKIRYDIVDYGIAGYGEWQARFGSDLFRQADAAKLASVVMFPGGTIALLKQNLVDRDLAKLVNLIILGDIRDYSPTYVYDAVFCDATHGEEEIRKNIPIIKSLIKNDFIVICDDI